MRPGFSVPDFAAPLDVGARLELIPPLATVKGMVLDGVLKETARLGQTLPGRGPYVGYKDYALSEFLTLQVEASAKMFPGLSSREGLRRLGQGAYPALFQSMIGRVLFGVLGKNPETLVKVAPKGYAVTGNTGQVDVLEATTQGALLRFREFYGFLDSYHIGVLEGAITACGRRGRVLFKPLGEIDGEMLCEWR
jgi:uncharacterized protein (TIGR02265 family)